MKLSTKGRYAMVALADIALQPEGSLVSLGDIAERQSVSLPYLEQLFVKLRRAELVASVRGPGGGYRLARPATDIRVVDVLAAPLAAYEVMELYKGLEPDGGIVDLPLTHITAQLIGRSEVIPNELAQFVREAFYDGFDEIISRVRTEEERIPDKWWIEIPAEERLEYDRMMQQARLELRDKGYYSPDMLTLQRKIRCRANGAREECTDPVE